MVSQNFSRQKRLLEAEHFKNVFDLPDKKLSTPYVLVLAHRNKLNHARLGLVIGKKNVRLAVQRNRLKRQIRETFRINQYLLDDYDIVVIARKGFAEISTTELQVQFTKFWKILSSKKVNKPEVSNTNV